MYKLRPLHDKKYNYRLSYESQQEQLWKIDLVVFLFVLLRL